jgi:hypothetical protein
MKKYEVVVQVGSPPQFFGVRPLLEKFIKEKIQFTCFTPVVSDEYSKNMFDQTYLLVRDDGFPVVRDIDGSEAKIFLAAWPSANIKYRYLLRYTYSLLSAKPNPVYLPESQRRYHGILTQNRFEYEMLKVYSNTYLVSNLKYIGWKKEKTSGKSILYLPTWNTASLGEIGKINSNEEIVPALEKLREARYEIIIKAHPLTISDPKASKTAKTLEKYADKYYESDTPIQDLLTQADLVISDNSGAIYEALYTNTPVVIYGNKTDRRKLGKILPMHHRLIKDGVIDNPQNPNDILNAVKIGLTKRYLYRQVRAGNELFRKDYTESAVNGWFDIVMKYLNDDINQDYILLHDYYNDYINSKTGQNTELAKKLAEYERLIAAECDPGIKTASRQLVRSVRKKIGIKK